ncbi:MAG: molybdopterin-dependent oxidoreductase [Gemmatimonadetes bacterium]|nr:molybdopterin-dependent oxidoreductase [Gemmatimonadota bacterium]
MSLDRRGFLKLTVLSTAGVAAGSGGQQLGAVLEATGTDERVANGPEQWVTTSCNLCSGGCGVRVRRIDARAVKLEGNPYHPLSRGGLCPVAQASLQLLYNPDRIRGPLERAGPRGSGQWRPLAWDEAIRMLAERLGALRQQERPHTVALVLGRSEGLLAQLFRRFARAYGTPNVLTTELPDPSAYALWRTQGIRAPIAYDLENAKYILSFGVPLVDGWWDPVRQMRALVQVRQGTPGRRGKLVQFEPRLSPTAAKADEWIPVNPGTEAALARGLAHLLVVDGRFDRDFVARHTAGFEDQVDSAGRRHGGFRDLLVREYKPPAVSRITGVPEETLRRIAAEFALYGPGVAIGPPAGHPDAAAAAAAVHALNALAGRIDRLGGALVARTAPLAPWPSFSPDTAARRGAARAPLAPSASFSPGAKGAAPDSGSISGLAAALRSGQPYPLEALLLWEANPVFSQPGSDRFREAVGRVPLVVSFSPFLDETAQLADLILPDPVFLEGWHDMPQPPGVPYPVISMAPPATDPLYQTRHPGDVLLETARALGGSVARAFPWQDFREAMRHAARGLYAASRGMVFATHGQEGPPAPLREWEWAPMPYGSFDEFFEELAAKGGWTDPSYGYQDWKRVLRTTSGRFEFPALPPHQVAPAAAPADDPSSLHLHTFAVLALGEGQGANQPFLQEVLAPHTAVQWGSWVELNPETAARLGIRDGDQVWVQSAAGRVAAQVRLYAGIMPGVAAMPRGQGHTALGRYARGRGVNVMELLGDERDPATGALVLSTRVRVTRA